MTFDNEAECKIATEALQGIEYRKSFLTVAPRTHTTFNHQSNYNNDDNKNKRPADNEMNDKTENDLVDQRDMKRKRTEEGDGEGGIVKTARDAVCPWWDVPYSQQLERKTKAMAKECLNKR